MHDVVTWKPALLCQFLEDFSFTHSAVIYSIRYSLQKIAVPTEDITFNERIIT